MREGTGLQAEPLAAHLPDVTGPMPIADISHPLNVLPGIPGLLGQPRCSRADFNRQVPVGLEVAWTIVDANGAIVTAGDNTFQSLDDLGHYQAMPAEFASSGSPEVSLVFVPQTTELLASPNVTTVTYKLNAKVRLFVGLEPTLASPNLSRTFSETIDLPPISITVPAVPIPFAATFFRHSSFQAWSGQDEGFALIVVPANSPLRGVAQFQTVLTELQTTVNTLQQFTNFAGLALGLSA